MHEAPLDDNYYPNTPLEEFKLEHIEELQSKIDNHKSMIKDLQFDIRELTAGLEASAESDSRKKNRIARANYLIEGAQVDIDDWESEIRILEGN